MIISINHQPSGGKEWVARIIGRHPKFKFEREFLLIVERHYSSSGKTGRSRFEIESGNVYEVNEPWNGRRFIDGENNTISAEDVLSHIERKEA